ncbi:helix-turn-helix domain-containing protein [Desulfitobacterium chlororespirans]|uniref:Helix-turn-helix domain-containing protein n=1 Tax=Desulfitobacterium chlororespirans DSM 11544 TaxID=1121395 RepID=A0A1M7SG51_9FIRM|nr:AraC family transcriptional regulator [Desulfitobacterium chlororespirans]SHN57463.1 Helix-turn-helix domain-containing protein [Desulfitobacterium chlororespirans DSM 11544]
MNCIIKYGRNVGAISDRVEADSHKHWLLQLFLSIEEELDIKVKGQLIPCHALLVNMDTEHAFNTGGNIHFTMLIDPTTELGRAMRQLLIGQSFYVLPQADIAVLQQAFRKALARREHSTLLSFVQSLAAYFTSNDRVADRVLDKGADRRAFDERIIRVLELLACCADDDESHQLKYFSQETYLSESRLAHLFKDETGIPLKSYLVLHKLQRAYESIFDGETITTAALRAGFDSPSHLAYTNKMMTGMSATSIIKDSAFLKVF